MMNSNHMICQQPPKRAAYYARVSTSLQEEQGTIESQKVELIQQIKKDGNILVKEYTDNGYSGAVLDRPAMDELRSELKNNVFDIVYFLDSDRIARDVSYQNIIISEFLKYKKEIVIKGQNYIHNPENKFSLTVLGAVNELEKSKITERLMRGRKEKARHGSIVNNANPYGYIHKYRKDNNERGEYTINDSQAEVIRFIFDQYAYTDASLHKIVQLLEDKGIPTPHGKLQWRRATLKHILNNSTYYGDHYYNRTERIESDPERRRNKNKYAYTKTGKRWREQDQWIKISVPAIIDKDVFDIVQEKLQRNRRLVRSSSTTHILSGIISCGVCGHTYSAVSNTKPQKRLYRCNYREKGYAHSDEVIPDKCDNCSIKADMIEALVLSALEEKIFEPSIIVKYVDVFKERNNTFKQGASEKLETFEKQIDDIKSKSQRVLDLYTDGLLDKAGYQSKLNELNFALSSLVKSKAEVERQTSLVEHRKEAKKAVGYYTKLAQKNYHKATPEQRKFIVRTIIKTVVLHKNERKNEIIIKGVLPTEAPLVVDLNKSDEVYYCTNYINSVALYHSTIPE